MAVHHNRKVALVTGASRGIGRGIALRLAREGYALVINSRRADPDNLSKGAYEVRDKILKAGGEAYICRADISLKEEREQMLDFLCSRLGRVDLLVNNAGHMLESQDILETREERFDQILNINLKGHFFVTQSIAAKMMEWKREGVVEKPRIVFITSVMAYMTSALGSDYAIAKAALQMTAKSFARRLGKEDIPVFDIAPGFIYTDMGRRNEENINQSIAEGKKLVTSRWGQPEDVAAVVSAIARGDLDYSTGSTIEVGGGYGLLKL